MEGTKPVRPLTYDFTATLVQKLKGKVRRAVVTHAKEGIYYSALIIDREGASVEIDARPSDSIILATKVKAPIFVSAKLFKENSIPLKEEKGPEASYGLTVQELTSSPRPFLFLSIHQRERWWRMCAAEARRKRTESNGEISLSMRAVRRYPMFPPYGTLLQRAGPP